MFDIGVINGGDMTVEAAYCKLKYLLNTLSYPVDLERIKQEMQIDLRGELTDNAYSVKYDGKIDNTLADPVFSGTAKDLYHFDPANIAYAVLRVQGIRIIGNAQSNLDADLIVKAFLNRSTISLEESEADLFYQIGIFREKLGIEDVSNSVITPISQNIEVTEKVRRLIRSDTRLVTLQLVSANGHSFTFDSMQLLIFTRDF